MRRSRAVLGVVLLTGAVGVLAWVSTSRGASARDAGVVGSEAAACGKERWTVKTLQDQAGRTLDLAKVVKTTVPKLRALPVKRGPGASRGNGVESTVYQVRARLVSAKLEDDSDIYLVIRGPARAGTMNVEFPLASSCTSNASIGAKARMRNARSAFVAACGMPESSSFMQLSGSATIRGVGFFDFIHGQPGIAPNGIELHPVLELTSATCIRTDTPSPPASSVVAGRYCGSTEQDRPLCLTTSADARTLVEFRSSSIVSCAIGADSPPVPFEIPLRLGLLPAVPIRSDRSFVLTYTGPVVNDQRKLPTAHASSAPELSYRAEGLFTTDGNVTGSLVVLAVTFDMDGDHYQCAGSPLRWNGTRQR